MKKIWMILPLLIIGMACSQNSQNTAEAGDGLLQTKVDSMSYAVGSDLITQFKMGLGGAYEFTFNKGAFLTGIEESFAGNDRFTKEDHQVMGMRLQMLANGLQVAAQSDPNLNRELPIKEEFSLETSSDSISYSVGAETATNINKAFQGKFADNFNNEAFLAGSKDGFTDNPKLDQTATDRLMTDFQTAYREAMMEVMRIEGEENQAAGEAFLAENATEEGVKTTDSGLQYKVIKQGKGKSPGPTDKVKVHYEGKLLNGEIFDSSIQRGEPISFALNGVIKGWTEGLQLMNVGSKYTFYIPGQLAYGLNPPPNSGIPPNATLVFDVELLGIE